MADFAYKPDLDRQRIIRRGPPTLKARFEDGTEIRREKHSAVKREFIYSYTENATDAKTLIDLLETKQLDTTFTILTFDPSATTPATDEATVTQMEMPETTWIGPLGPVRVDCRFMEA